jgi:hypothetical protein
MSHQRRPGDCPFCEMVKLLYPTSKADTPRAALLVLAHLELHHHIGVEPDPAK